MAVQGFRDLIVWQRAMELVESVYRATEDFPSKERYGLTNQLRRAAVSIPSNIAEGQGRNTTLDFLRFLSISRGSLQEVQTQIELTRRLGYLDEARCAEVSLLADEVAKLINGLCRSLNASH